VTGVYMVSLKATGAGGSDTLTRTNCITVTSGSTYSTTTTVITYTCDATNHPSALTKPRQYGIIELPIWL
jgi:PKD repeat protein